ncbi:MAG: methyltransferase, partial [Acidimicrobiia bacterium]|nr:methyltransferase [Acidimicrobiia bacterium]
MIGQYTVIDGCRSCGSTDLSEVLDLGAMPLADALVDPTAEGEEPHFPLSVWFCSDCTLVQIRESVPPEVLFGADYPYYSSFSDALLDHSRSNVTDLIARCGLDESSLAVEIASNDGYLLQYFRDAGVPVLGIDPAPGPAEAARRRGIPTRGGFFGTELARTLVEEGVAAHVVVANNVL